ncbi:hypothetical protein [Hyphomicrobium sp.]|uniref:hypothetical protein n=1 Tax=Hyphomicrobium sp. TaxID=82 RepID=UPI002D77EF21|nr:hypothetical protein [Hyphomicrobium sp.]HET6388500.1 hypothetical protein [Hyphomicrobium sp.]
MLHIVHIPLNSEALRQLDDLRQVYPKLYNRQDILLELLAEAHQRLTEFDPPPAPERKLLS